jgi:hypothetical protein
VEGKSGLGADEADVLFQELAAPVLVAARRGSPTKRT